MERKYFFHSMWKQHEGNSTQQISLHVYLLVCKGKKFNKYFMSFKCVQNYYEYSMYVHLQKFLNIHPFF